MKIDKDIPIPTSFRSRWALLDEVGDSVFIEDRDEKTRYVMSANGWGKRLDPPRAFKAYYETDSGTFVSTANSSDQIVGVRLWRVK